MTAGIWNRAVNVLFMTKPATRFDLDGFHLRIPEWWERILRLVRRPPQRLRLCESLPLGERRFVAVVEFDAERFLVGGTPSSMVLLSRLPDCSQASPQVVTAPATNRAGKNREKC